MKRHGQTDVPSSLHGRRCRESLLYIYSHREALKGGKEVEERGRRRKREESGKEGIRALN